MKKLKLFFVLGLLMAGLGAQAETAIIDGINYDLKSTKQATVIKLPSGVYSGDVVIPAQVEYNSVTYNVTAIGNFAFQNNKNLLSVDLPYGLKTIGEQAFSNCTKLVSAALPLSLTLIEQGAFEWTAITYAYIPDGCSMGNGAFLNCKSMKTVYLPASLDAIPQDAFWGSNAIEEIYCHNTTPPTVGKDAFDNVSPNAVYVPVSAETAYKAATGWSAFASVMQSQIKGVEIDNIIYDLNIVASTATVADNRSLDMDTVFIPQQVSYQDKKYNVRTIGGSAFQSNKSIQHVFISLGVTYIESYAFDKCTNLVELVLPASLQSIGNAGLRSTTKLETLVCRASVPPTLGTDALDAAKSTANVYVPVPADYSVSTCPWSYFTNIQGLASYTPEAFVDGIKYRFNLMDYTASVIRPVTGDPTYTGAFVIPAEVLYMNEPYTVTAIEQQAFSASTVTSVFVPATVANIKANTFYNATKLKTITVDPDNTTYSSEGGVLFNKEKTSLQAYPYAGAASYTIPNGVTTIATSAFAQCHLTEVTMPATMTHLGISAFNGCTQLQKITCLATTVPTVSTYTFKDVPATTEVRVPLSSVPNYVSATGWKDLSIVTTVDAMIDGINYRLDATTNIAMVLALPMGKYTGELSIPKYVELEGATFDVRIIAQDAFYENTGLTAVDLPQSLKIIQSGAFMGSGLKEIIIPDGVETIGPAAFARCLSAKKLDISATVSAIQNDAFYNCNALEQIICRRLDPPAMGYNDPFDLVNKSIPVYVADDKVTAYKAADWWKEFSNITATKTITVEGVYYNLHVIAGTADAAGCTDGTTDVVILGQVEDDKVVYMVKKVGNFAFQLNNTITSVKIAEGINEIGKRAFDKCYSLQSIVLPSTLSIVGDAAFESITSLASITCRAVVPPTTGSTPFNGTPQTANLYVPSTSISAYTASTCPWSYFTNCDEAPTSAEAVIDGINYRFNLQTFEATVLRMPTGGKYSGHVKINSFVVYDYNTFDVVAVDDYAFADYNALTSVTIYGGVLTIGEYAFRNSTSLKEVTIPDCINSIGQYAFSGCTALEVVYCKAITVPTTGAGVFNNVTTSNVLLYVPFYGQNDYKTTAPWSGFSIRNLNEVVYTCNLTIYGFSPTALTVGTVWTSEMAKQVTNAFQPIDPAAPYHLPETMGRLMKWNGSDYDIVDGYGTGVVLTEGKYKFRVQVRIDNDAAKQYRFPYADEGDITANVMGMPWSLVNRYVGAEYSYIHIISPEFTLTATGIEDVNHKSEIINHKLMIDGQIYILRDGKTYTVTGMEVR